MSDTPRRYGVVQSWVRLALAFTSFALTATCFFGVAILLLPWRGLRLDIAGAYARFIARPIMWIAGARTTVEHAERVAAQAPAVYLINHASAMDAVVLMYVWPPRGVAIGKKEVLWIPFFGQAYWLAGMVLIDRFDHDSAVAAIDGLIPVVKRLGLSPLLSPEGTRADDGSLGPFKKGFVHVALATGLPVVPIVIHGAFDRLPARRFTLAPGDVRVEILEAVDTSGWSADTVDAHVAQIREIYVEALGVE